MKNVSYIFALLIVSILLVLSVGFVSAQDDNGSGTATFSNTITVPVYDDHGFSTLSANFAAGAFIDVEYFSGSTSGWGQSWLTAGGTSYNVCARTKEFYVNGSYIGGFPSPNCRVTSTAYDSVHSARVYGNLGCAVQEGGTGRRAWVFTAHTFFQNGTPVGGGDTDLRKDWKCQED